MKLVTATALGVKKAQTGKGVNRDLIAELERLLKKKDAPGNTMSGPTGAMS